MRALLTWLSLAVALHGAAALPRRPLPRWGGWLEVQSQIYGSNYFAAKEADDAEQRNRKLYPDAKEANFTQPLDHFGKANHVTFPQRFFYSLRHYKEASKREKGAPCPIYIFDNGEISAWERLNVLDHGIVDILAAATGGIALILENRFYGTSHPLRSQLGPGVNWTTDQLEFHTYKQTLADTAAFIEHLNITGVNEDLTAKSGNARVIIYGGSYAGARVAHLRKLYPHLIHGAISSSGVVGSVINNYGYFHPVARGNNATSMQALAAAITAMDRIIAPEPEKGNKQTKRDQKKVEALLELAGLKGIKDPIVLADLADSPLGYHQSNTWYRPHSQAFDDWLRQIGYTNETLVGPMRNQRSKLGLTEEDAPEELLRLISVTKAWYIDPCVNQKDSSAVKCFGPDPDTSPVTVPELDNNWAWFFFTCTSVGFFQSATPVSTGNSLTPGGPRIVSALLDEAEAGRYCKVNYPVGPSGVKRIPERPDNKYWNSFGGFQIDAPRLALVNGQFDPWREVSAHSELYANGGTRPNTLDRPTILIPEGIHHDDEYGVDPKYKIPMPYRVKVVQDQLIAAAKHWLADKPDKPPVETVPARRQHPHHPHHEHGRRGSGDQLLLF